MSSTNEMTKKPEKTKRKSKKSSEAKLQALSVAGYKSIGDTRRIEVRPLTLLAGANSGGKSSLIQPMLLLKQTLDARYDPGCLLLDGPNVRITSTTQLFSTHLSNKAFVVGLDFGIFEFELSFEKASSGHGLDLRNNLIRRHGEPDAILNMHLDQDGAKAIISNSALKSFPPELLEICEYKMRRDRCFIAIDCLIRDVRFATPYNVESNILASFLQQMIHLPGLRGNPERTYKTTAVWDTFPGTFESYVASIINHWGTNTDPRLQQLGNNLETLGLTWKVTARALYDTQVELQIGRLPHSKQGGANELVNIADVGSKGCVCRVAGSQFS